MASSVLRWSAGCWGMQHAALGTSQVKLRCEPARSYGPKACSNLVRRPGARPAPADQLSVRGALR